MTFAEKLKQARKNKRLSQAELARRIGISRAAISRYESGERTQISTPIVISIAKCLDVNPLYLSDFPGEEEQRKEEHDDFTNALFNSEIFQFAAEQTDSVGLIVLLTAFCALNSKGRTEAVKAVSNLTFVPEYQRGVDISDSGDRFDDDSILELIEAVNKISQKNRKEE